MTIKSNTPASDRYRLIEDYLYLDGDTVRYKKDSPKHPNHSHRAGDEIKTSINGSGYRQVCFAGIQMFVHVVVFALHNKRMPILAGCILGSMKILNLLVWLPVRLSTNITDNMRGLYD